MVMIAQLSLTVETESVSLLQFLTRQGFCQVSSCFQPSQVLLQRYVSWYLNSSAAEDKDRNLQHNLVMLALIQPAKMAPQLGAWNSIEEDKGGDQHNLLSTGIQGVYNYFLPPESTFPLQSSYTFSLSSKSSRILNFLESNPKPIIEGAFLLSKHTKQAQTWN